jgi:hypothetical protein
LQHAVAGLGEGKVTPAQTLSQAIHARDIIMIADPKLLPLKDVQRRVSIVVVTAQEVNIDAVVHKKGFKDAELGAFFKRLEGLEGATQVGKQLAIEPFQLPAVFTAGVASLVTGAEDAHILFFAWFGNKHSDAIELGGRGSQDKAVAGEVDTVQAVLGGERFIHSDIDYW